MSNSSLVLLFGAGASKGAGHVQPDAPPLMSELYERLAEQHPAEWGPASDPGKYSSQFRQDFEKTYSEVVIKEAPFTPSPIGSVFLAVHS